MKCKGLLVARAVLAFLFCPQIQLRPFCPSLSLLSCSFSSLRESAVGLVQQPLNLPFTSKLDFYFYPIDPLAALTFHCIRFVSLAPNVMSTLPRFFDIL